MATTEITSTINRVSALNGIAVSSNTTTVGNIIDTADFDGGINFTIIASIWTTDRSFLPLIEESEDSGMSGANAVADTNLVPQDFSSSDAPELQATLDANNAVTKIGVVGSKRYLRLSLVSTGSTGGATVNAIAERKAELQPTV